MYSDKIGSFCRGVKIDLHTSLHINKKLNRKIPKDDAVSHHIIKCNALQNTLLYQP